MRSTDITQSSAYIFPVIHSLFTQAHITHIHTVYEFPLQKASIRSYVRATRHYIERPVKKTYIRPRLYRTPYNVQISTAPPPILPRCRSNNHTCTYSSFDLRAPTLKKMRAEGQYEQQRGPCNPARERAYMYTPQTRRKHFLLLFLLLP